MNLKSHIGKISILFGILLFVPLGDSDAIGMLKFVGSIVGFVLAIWAIARKQYVTGIIGLLLNLVGVAVLVLFMGLFALLTGALISGGNALDSPQTAPSMPPMEQGRSAVPPPPPALPPSISKLPALQDAPAKPMADMAFRAADHMQDGVDVAVEAVPSTGEIADGADAAVQAVDEAATNAVDAAVDQIPALDAPVMGAPVDSALSKAPALPKAPKAMEAMIPPAMENEVPAPPAMPDALEAPAVVEAPALEPVENPTIGVVSVTPPPAPPAPALPSEAPVEPAVEAPAVAQSQPDAGYSMTYKAPDGLETVKETLDMPVATLFEVDKYRKTASGAMIWRKGLWKAKGQSLEDYIQNKVTFGYPTPFKTHVSAPLDISGNGGDVSAATYVTFYNDAGYRNPETVVFYDAGEYVGVLGLSAPTAEALKASWAPFMRSAKTLRLKRPAPAELPPVAAPPSE